MKYSRRKFLDLIKNARSLPKFIKRMQHKFHKIMDVSSSEPLVGYTHRDFRNFNNPVPKFLLALLCTQIIRIRNLLYLGCGGAKRPPGWLPGGRLA